MMTNRLIRPGRRQLRCGGDNRPESALSAEPLINVEYDKKRVATQPPPSCSGQTIAIARVERDTQGGARGQAMLSSP
jgi:hypothetical protein